MNKIRPTSPLKPFPNPKAGFALVASISIMAVLVLIAVALFSLSSVATKSATITAAQTEAQANAKAALMMAIGDLQKYTGADTRITAPANIVANDEADLEIVDDNMPKLVGAWRSWEGLNHDSTGRPIATINGTPIYDLKEQANSPSGTGRFLSWLVSSATPGSNLNNPQTLAYLTETTVNDVTTIPLLTAGDEDDDGDGSLRDADPGNNVPKPREIHVLPTLSDSSRFAWWVSPENQKARLAQPHEARTNSTEALVEMGQSHVVPNPEVFGFNDLINNPEPFNVTSTTGGAVSRAINRDTLNLVDSSNSAQPQKSFHDLSTSATGLLTNTATGGWRKDLSVLTEKWDDIYTSYPGGKLPLFRYSPGAGATSQVPKPTTDTYDPDQSTFYPWSRHSQFSPKKWPNTWQAASSSWQSLANFATMYKDFTYGEGAAESPFIWSPVMKWRWQGSENDATDQEFFDYNHIPRLHPVVARFQFIIYVRAYPDPTRAGRYGIEMVWSPVVTLWNPFNVRLSIDNPGPPNSGVVVGGKRSFPAAFTAEPLNWFPGGPDTIPLDRYRMLTQGNMQYMDTNGNFGSGNHDHDLPENTSLGYKGGTSVSYWKDLRTWGVNFPTGTLTFEPGEVRMFTANSNSTGAFAGSALFDTNRGHQPSAPEGIGVSIRGGNVGPTDFFWFNLKNEVYTKPFRFRSAGRGFHIAFGTNTGDTYQGAVLYTGVSQEMMSSTALTNGNRAQAYWPEDDLEPHGYSVAEIASVPAMPLYSISIGPRFTIGAGVGTPQNRPTKGFLQSDPLAGMSLVDPGIENANSHPANGNFEMSYNTLAFGSTLTPNLSDREGFIVTGFQSGDGISRLVTHEIPLRPMASLVELQGWNPRGHNPYPPYQSNLIGNSDASPLIPNNNIVPTTLNPNSVEENLQHDDAYCANHLLFDDWFVSSIGPQPQSLGGNIATEMETYYRNYLTGAEQLTNRAYQPIPEDSNLSPTEVTTRTNEILNSSDGFLKVASRFIVNGMFNVNSTSVDAWKALLGHARNRSQQALQGLSSLDSIPTNNDHVVTRGAIAYDAEAGEDSVVSGHFENATEFTGFRSLTDAQIEDLAEKIVEQVRLRGPFLSLSEFVNRQLSDDNDMALAGAVQSAINNLNVDPMEYLRDPNNSLSETTMSPSDNMMDGVDYAFEEAAAGDSAYGAPGWIRQADVLRPIAPILSARDDTFTIRAYGDKLDNEGNVLAQAWCEAVVRRTRDFCDSSEQADRIESPASAINAAFGRRYEIVNFRWLSPTEV